MDVALALIFSLMVIVVLFKVATTFYFQSVSAAHCPFMCKYRKKWDYSADDTFHNPVTEGFQWNPIGGLLLEPDLGVFDRAKEWAMPQPSTTGCYCGVRKRTGKYLHAKMDPGDDEIWEFHLTNQPPAAHNAYVVPDTIDHTSDCGNVDESWDQYTNTSSCLIFSVEENDGGNDDCSLINVSQGATITGADGETVKDEIGSQNWNKIKGVDVNPLDEDDFKFGNKYKFVGKHRNPGYRALLSIPEAYPQDKKVGAFILWPTNLTCTNIGERTVWMMEGKEALRMGA